MEHKTKRLHALYCLAVEQWEVIEKEMNRVRNEVISSIAELYDKYGNNSTLPITPSERTQLLGIYYNGDAHYWELSAVDFLSEAASTKTSTITAIEKCFDITYFLNEDNVSVAPIETISTPTLIRMLEILERLNEYSSVGIFDEDGHATVTYPNGDKATISKTFQVI